VTSQVLLHCILTHADMGKLN